MPRSRRLPLLAVLLVLLGVGFVGEEAARADTAQITILQDQAHVLADPVDTFPVLRSLGVTEVRIFVPWGRIAPRLNSRRRPAGFTATNPAAYRAANWAPYDAAVRAATADGVGVYFDFMGPAPLWATSPAPRGTAPHNPNLYEPSATQFGQFVAAVGTRYDGRYKPKGAATPLPRVKFWGIWNEPNYGQDLAPQAIHGIEVAPLLYRSMLDAAWASLRSTGHGSDTILFGETAPRGSPYPAVGNGTVPLRFLRALYCVSSSYQELRGQAAAERGCPATAAASRRFRAQNPALFEATGYADHMYTLGQKSSPSLQTSATEPDWAGLADLPRLERTLDRLTAIYGSHTRFPIYNTEFGFQTNPPRNTCGCVFLSPATAAYYLNWSEYLMWANPRVRSDSQYLLYDGIAQGHPAESDFSSGLIFANGTHKPDYDAFRLPLYLPVTTTRPGRPLDVWGGARPAGYAARDSGSPQQVRVQFRARSSGAWTTLWSVAITNPQGYFEVPISFPSSGSVRLTWTYPTTFASLPYLIPATVTSRTQRITVL